MGLYDRAKAYLSMMIYQHMRLHDPHIEETHINTGAPVRHTGCKGRHWKEGVDRSSNYGQQNYAGKDDRAYHCGQKFPTGVARCCAYHYKMWQERNPGNGRYVSETWKKLDASDFLEKPLFKDYWSFEEFLIERMYTEEGVKFTLTREDDDTEYEICVKDCLIDAQRAAAKHMGLALTQPVG